MAKKKKRKLKINITAMESGIRNYMRNHPLWGEEYRREEAIEELFKPKPRRFR
jgi:hypothetical protein